MAKLNSIFDYQKIAENKKLQDIIDDTQARYFLNSELSEDELENVSGGSKLPQFMKAACPYCTTSNNINVQAKYYICGKCGRRVDING